MGSDHRRFLPCFRLLTLAALLAMLFTPSGVLSRANTAIIYEKQRLAPASITPGDHFGTALALSGDRLIVGADNHAPGGAVYVFERDTSGWWNETAMLLPSDPSEYNTFGYSLALSGSTAFVGSPNHPNGEIAHAGAVYRFERDARGRWNEAGKILPADPAEADSFGISLALDGDRLAVGSIHSTDYGQTCVGSVYLFARDGSGNWNQVVKLQSDDPETDDHFGDRLALSGDTLFVSDFGKDIDGIRDAGVVDVFERDDNGNWGQVTRLLPGNSTVFGYFGYSIALHGSRAVISELVSRGLSRSGTVYVFERDASGNWMEANRLPPDDSTNGGDFGGAVAMNNDDMLVGSMYLLHHDSGGSWNVVDRLLMSDMEPGNYSAYAVALSDDLAATGSSPYGGGCGAVYLFDLPHLPTPVISEPAPGSVLRTGTPTIRGSAVTGSRVYVREGADLLCTALVDPLGAWSCTPSGALKNGSHTITATASNRSSPASVTFTLELLFYDMYLPVVGN